MIVAQLGVASAKIITVAIRGLCPALCRWHRWHEGVGMYASPFGETIDIVDHRNG